MATNNAHQAKSAKEELLELLEKKPKIYQDAVTWTLACWTGIASSSLFKDKDFFNVDRAASLKELQEDGFIRLENDPKGTSEVIVHLTEQGSDEIVDLFYSKKGKRKIERKRALVHFSTGKWRRRKDSRLQRHIYTVITPFFLQRNNFHIAFFPQGANQ